MRTTAGGLDQETIPFMIIYMNNTLNNQSMTYCHAHCLQHLKLSLGKSRYHDSDTDS